MNCMEARRMVTPYIQKKLSDKKTEQFLKHVESCPECMDELDIYFTVYKAVYTLESGSHHIEYDFRKMLEEDIHQSWRRIAGKKFLHLCHRVLLIVAEILLILTVLTAMEDRIEANQHVTDTIHRLKHGVVHEIEVEESETSDLPLEK